MREPPKCLVALAAACALLASCAIQPVTLPAGVDFRPAARTTLVASHDLNFLVARWREGEELTTVLACQQAGADPRPVARLVQMRRGADLYSSIQRLPESLSTAGRSDHEAAVLAQLYALVLRQDPLARYCLSSDRQPCDAARDGVSQAQVLNALANARKQVAERTPAAVPWRVVEMTAAPTRTRDADVVGVRATSDQAPLEGVPIYFNREPHSICMARTGVDGVAVCRLVDQYGDAHEHDHAGAVVATFPGKVGIDQVLPPTTHVLLPRAPFAQPPSFAPPGKR